MLRIVVMYNIVYIHLFGADVRAESPLCIHGFARSPYIKSKKQPV